MRINPTLKESLKKTSLGRAKLKMLYALSGREGYMPTKKQGVDFVHAHSEPFNEFYGFLLTLGRCRAQTFKGKANIANLNSALKKLDQFPVEEPVFYQFKSKFNEDELCAYVKGDKLRDYGGYVYTVIIFDEECLPGAFRSVVEIRSSQDAPEPAFTATAETDWKVSSKEDPAIFEDPILSICIDLLIDLANNHLNPLIPMNQPSQPDFKSKQMAGTIEPKDKTLNNWLKLLGQGRAQCFVAEIPLEKIVPFSYDHCFKIPLYLIEFAESVIKTSNFEMLVYEADDMFVMSDCYPAYLAFRKVQYKTVRVVVVGQQSPKDVTIIKTGGIELIPPVMAMSSGGYDHLDGKMKNSLLDKYLKKLSMLNNGDDIMNAQCVVLTEDSGIEMLEVLLQASEFNIDETLILSYKNCTNLDSLDITVKMIKNLNPYTTVLIHIDRDYKVEQEVVKSISRIQSADAIPFVTTGTDIESYFINVNHIADLYPTISRSVIEGIIEDATNQTRDASIEFIKKHEHGDKHKSKASYLDGVVVGIFESNKARYRHGKKTLGALKGLLQKETGTNVNLIKPTTSLKDEELNAVALKIWNYDQS